MMHGDGVEAKLRHGGFPSAPLSERDDSCLVTKS
jgi:hypothetical protein